MDVYDILKILWRLRKGQNVTGLIEQLLKKAFPEFDNIKSALAKVRKSLLYIGYEYNSIEMNVKAVEEKVKEVKYEVRGVTRSIHRRDRAAASQ